MTTEAPANTIEYEITLKVNVPEGMPKSMARPYEDDFYEGCYGWATVTRAQRITPGIAYGGPR